jgi:hypothetical protein
MRLVALRAMTNRSPLVAMNIEHAPSIGEPIWDDMLAEYVEPDRHDTFPYESAAAKFAERHEDDSAPEPEPDTEDSDAEETEDDGDEEEPDD